MVKIICDSTGDIPEEMRKQYDITIVPLNVLFGTDSYQDGVNLTGAQFYKMLVEGKVHPTTSQPAPGLFAEAYKKLAKETDEILVLTISAGISGTYESAMQAKQLVDSSLKIEIIDSRWTCAGLLLQTLTAARAAEKGMKLAEITAMVKDILPKIRVYMIFDTLEYLRKGGRIGLAKAMLGGMLKLNPVLTLREGVIHPVTQARGRARAVNMLVDLIKKTGNPGEIVVEDATTPEELEDLTKRISAAIPGAKIIRTKVGPTIGVHAGPRIMVAGAISTV
ncbi:MAG: DegV family protein [Chloroflexi bacterium]|nr:DegV family protein [Chloroflexota bacterium]